MAWVVETQSRADDGIVVLAEEVTAVGTKTLTWGADYITDRTAELLGVRIEFTATATSGTRRQKLQLKDGTNDVQYEQTSNVTTTAAGSATFEFFQGGAGGAALGTVTPERLAVGFFLAPGQKLTITQDAVIDALDTAVVHVRLRMLK